jgi:osmotically-inducible protein OsmY
MNLGIIRSVRSASLKPRLSRAAIFALTCVFSGCTMMPDYASAASPDSAALRDRVVDRLAHDRVLLPLTPLNVQARNQIVYLYGTVSTDLQRDRAESVAAQTPGVKKIENLIAVVE